jgi:protein-S-isoprenylcysteine O-methyltransferase Ste14
MKTNYSILHRSAVFAYGVASYLVTLVTFGYIAGFMGNFLVPKPLDAPATGPFWPALLINLGLITLFSLQHSVMARPAFKKWWTRYVPEAAERSTYVLFSCLALVVLFAFWQPMGGTIWEVKNQTGRTVLYALYALGWALLFASTYFINHFDLFGLRQVWLHLRGREYTSLNFGTPILYKYVRHPLYIGWFTTFWATPTMTVAHLVFALGTTAYILLAIRWEERDLVTFHPEYEEYRQRVPKFIPRRRAIAELMSANLPRGASKSVIAEVR